MSVTLFARLSDGPLGRSAFCARRLLVGLSGFALAFSALGEDAFIQSDGTQYIPTGYFASPNTKIVCDFAYTSVSLQQQRIFGTDADDSAGKLSISSYINGGGMYAWAFQDGKGNWTATSVKADTSRRTLTLDGPGNKAELKTGSTVSYSSTISTVRTATSIWPLTIFTDNRSTDYSSRINPAKAQLYAFAIFDNGVLMRYYKPYKSSDGTAVGLKDLVSGEIVTSPVGNAFATGGDISADPDATDFTDIRKNASGQLEFLTSVDPGTDGTVALTKNGDPVAGTSVWATSADTITVTATAAAGKRFTQWKGLIGSFAPGSYGGDATVTIIPRGPTSISAVWVTTKTRYWNPTNNAGGYYYWKYANNWKDESGNTGKPLIGDTVVFGATTTGAYHLSEDNSSNPLYEVRYEDNKTVSMNQGSFALLAGGMGLQYLRKANSGSNWSGIRVIGDGIVPVNIANAVEYVMQKGCLVGSLSGYRSTPTIVKQGPGTVINFNQSGTYTYSVPKTIIQAGRWDITHSLTLNSGCTIGFEGEAAKKLTFCYDKYLTDLTFDNGGIYEIGGAKNHVIGANGKTGGRVVFSGSPKFNPMVFSGRFTEGAGLVWSPTSSNYTFVCSNAVSDTQGELSVVKGTVKLIAGASFTRLSKLSVSPEAVFEIEDGSGANFAATALAVGDATSKLKLPAGVTLAFTTATQSGAALPPGTYASTAGENVKVVAWIEGAGRLTVAEGPANADTWCGGDAESTDLSRDANWALGSAPDVTKGDLLATFATGGAEARLSSAASFDGLVFTSTFGGSSFAFTAGTGVGATVGANGISALDAAEATTWNVGWPITLGTAQTWKIGANDTVRFTEPISGSAALSVENSGTVEFAAPNTHTGALELKGGTVRVTANNGLGPAGRTVKFHHKLTKYVFSGDITLDAPMYSDDQQESFNSFMSVEPGSHVTFNGNFGYKAEGGITFGEGSVTVFNGGLKFETDGMKGRIQPYGSGTIIVSNKNISTCRSWVGSASHPITIELCSAWNVFNDGAYWAHFPSGRMVTRVDNAVHSGGLLFECGDFELDLDGHDMEIGLLAATAQTRVTSASPATLTVTSATIGDNQNGSCGGTNRVDKAVFSGLVSFKKTGAYPHTFGSTSTSTGSVEVTQGVVKMNSTGKWPNAGEVRVAGGKIVTENAEAFGSNTVWRVTTGEAPVVQLDHDGELVCSRLYVDGKRVGGGVYGAIGSGAAREVAWIAGRGFLAPVPHGILVILK